MKMQLLFLKHIPNLNIFSYQLNGWYLEWNAMETKLQKFDSLSTGVYQADLNNFVSMSDQV